MTNSDVEKLCGIKLEISDEDIDTAIQSMAGYLFYKNIPGGRHFECSRCRSTFDILNGRRLSTGDEDNALNAGHNEEGACPRCGGKVTFKQDAKTKSGFMIRERRNFAVPYVINEDLCYVVCFSLYRGYNPGRRIGVDKWIDTIYELKPGSAVKYYHSYENYWESLTYSTSKIVPPFPYGSWAVSSYLPYKFMEMDRLNSCFLRWSAWEKWGYPGSLCEYLYSYCTHMQFEFLLKIGLRKVVEAVTLQHMEMKLQFDWNAKGMKFFKTLTRDDLKEFKEKGCSIDALKFRDRFSRICALTFKEAEKCANSAYMTGQIKNFLLKYRKSPLKYIKYMDDQKREDTEISCPTMIYMRRSALGDYADYLEMCKRCDVDLFDDTVFFPKDIFSAHDRMLKIQNALAREKKMFENAEKELEAEKLLKARRKKYEWSDDRYTVIVPATLSAIVAEGQAQKNCVAGYTDRHAKGTLTILFIRYSSEPDKSLITVEMSKNGEIKQALGVRNTRPDPSALAFIEKYKKHLEYEKKKKGKKKNGKDSSDDAA